MDIQRTIHYTDYRVEDGGSAIIISVADEFDNNDDGQYISITSWSEDGKTHPDWIKNAKGKKFRIIVEEIN